EVAHDDDDFFDGLTHSKNHSGFGGNLGRDTFHVTEDVHHPGIAPAWPRFLVESGHRFGVVVVDLGTRFENGADAVVISLEIGNEDFDGAIGNTLVDLSNGFGEDPGSEIWEVVAIDRGDYRVLQSHLGAGFGDAMRLSYVVF